MLTRDRTTLAAVALGLSALLGLAGCGDEEPEVRGAGGAGGTGGTGGVGGTGGEAPAGCDALPLPGPIEEGVWRSDFTVAGFTGLDGVVPSVHDLVIDPEGDLVAAGYFSWIGTQAVDPVVRLRDGAWSSLDTEWGSEGAPFEIGAIAYGPAGSRAASTHQQRISFTGPEPAGRIFVDRGSGMEVIGAFDGQVRELAWIGDELWALGDFTIGEGAAAGLAIWDGESWSPAPGGAVDGPVLTLRQEEGVTLVGGSFTRIGGIAANSIAAWDGSAWTAIDTDFIGTVQALDRGPGGELIAAGYLVMDLEDASGSIVQQQEDGSWQLVGGGVGQGVGPGVVSDLQWFDGELFVSGCFNYLGGDVNDEAALFTSQLARWDGEAWEPIESTAPFSAWYDPRPCGPWTSHQKMLVHDERLYLAGSFGAVGQVASQAIVAFDGEQWLPVGAEAGHGVTGAIRKLAVGGPACTAYAFGEITHGGGTPTASRLLRWEDGWHALGDAAPAGHECDQLAVSGAGRVFVGCSEWPEDGSEPRGRIFEVGDSWKPVGEGSALDPIYGMAIDPHDRLWVVGGGSTGYVARLDEEAFTVVEEAFDGVVTHIAFEPGAALEKQGAVVAGWFGKVGAVDAAQIARFDGDGWHALGEGFTTGPTALAWGASGIFASTGSDGSSPNLVLGRWDGNSWKELATPENGLGAPAEGDVHTFTALLARGDHLIATGSVWPAAGGAHAFLWDGERFTAIGGGIAAMSVDAAAITADGLLFGGWIAEVGPPDARIPSVGAALLEWPGAD